MVVIRRCDSARPTPLPSTALDWAPSRSNGVKSLGSSTAGMPIPVSWTMMSRFVGGRQLAPDLDPAAGAVVLDCVRDQVEHDLAKSTTVAVDVLTRASALSIAQSNLRGRGHGRHHGHRLGQQFRQQHGLEREIESVAFDLGDVEHIVDQGDQMPATTKDVFQRRVLGRP